MRDISTRDRETEEQKKMLECSVCGMKVRPDSTLEILCGGR